MSIREQRTTEIIEAAMKVFGKHGFHKAKIEEIAKLAGIGKGTVYEYFSSKKDLFQQMIKYIAENYFYMAKKAMDKEETVYNKLIAFGQHHGKFISTHIDMAESIITSTGFISEEMKHEIFEMKKEIFLLIEKTVEKGIETGEIKSDLNKEIAVMSILGAINHNYTLQVCYKKISPNNIDPRPIVDIIFNGLTNTN